MIWSKISHGPEENSYITEKFWDTLFPYLANKQGKEDTKMKILLDDEKPAQCKALHAYLSMYAFHT